MATDRRASQTIVGRVGLLGASAGIVLGLIEAGGMRSAELSILKPHVPPSFWFFDPLLTSVAFGLLGLLAGFLATLPRSRFLGMVIIASLGGLSGAYLALVLQYTRSGSLWYPTLEGAITPATFFAGAFAWTLPALWVTRKPDSPLGFLADVPQRPWSAVVFGSVATLAVAVGISHFPDHLTVSTAHATAGSSQSPNIVLIVWDTTRADHLSSYGYFRNTTPNLDQFAKQGVLFENAISASSWTLPGMASAFTGLLPHQHAGGPMPLGNGPRTLAEILRLGGYETAGFNANPGYGTVTWGLARGFETYTDSTHTLGFNLDATRIGREFIEPYSEEWFHRGRFNQFTARQLNEEVYRWFDHRSDRPFFLFVNYNDAHGPYEVPSPYNRLYGQESEEAKNLLQTAHPARFYLPPGEQEGVIAAYDNCLNYIDGQLGELLRFLEHSPKWSNTYVIITSDHGETFGEHGPYGHGMNLYRELLHVPLIIAGPGIPSGVRVKDTATTRRIFPTALELAGMKAAVLHRTSLSRLWDPGYVPTTPDEPTLSEVLGTDALPAPQGMITITTREWQLIYRPTFPHNRLYHWPTDPLEQQNVADLAENQALVEHLKESMLSIVRRSYRPWRDPRYLVALSGPDFSPDLEALKSIPLLPGRPLFPPGPGAPQALFPQNPDTPQQNDKDIEKALLENLPYVEP